MGSYPARTHRLKTGAELLIRSAELDDALAVLTHGRSIVQEDLFAVTTPAEFVFTEELERNWIREYGDDPGKLLLVAETEQQLIGILGVEAGQSRRQSHRAILHMSVNHDWRSRGVGTALLESAVEWACSHPLIEKLSLAVYATNVPAIGLYKKLGFIEEGRRHREIKLGPDQYADDLIMSRFV